MGCAAAVPAGGELLLCRVPWARTLASVVYIILLMVWDLPLALLFPVGLFSAFNPCIHLMFELKAFAR